MSDLAKPKSFLDRIFGCSVINTKGVFAIILPLLLTRILESLIGMVDTAFTSSYGPDVIVANGIIGTTNVLLMNVTNAICLGGTVFVAQYKGKEDDKGIVETIGQTVSLSVPVSIITTLIVIFFGKPFLQVAFSSTEQSILDTSYIYLVLLSSTYCLFAIGNAILCILSGLGDSKACLFVGTSSGIVNIIGVFIFVVNFRMGIYGTALALAIHRIWKLSIGIYLLKRNHPELRLTLKSLIVWNTALIKKMLSVSIPIALELLFFNAGSIVHGMVIARCGTAAIKANAIVPSLVSVFDTIILAFESGASSIIGRCVGAGKPREARKMTYSLLGAAVILSGLFLVVYLPFYPIVLQGYSPTAEVVEMVPLLLFTYVGAKLVFGAANQISCIALRATGDSFYTSTVSLIGMWGVSVVLAYLLAIHFNWGLIGTWVATYAYWAFRSIFFIVRIQSKKWCHKKLV